MQRRTIWDQSCSSGLTSARAVLAAGGSAAAPAECSRTVGCPEAPSLELRLPRAEGVCRNTGATAGANN